MLYLGIDIGSTTIKTVFLDEKFKILYSDYRRHFSEIKKSLKEILKSALKILNEDCTIKTVMTGSGAIDTAEKLGINFLQEVIACTEAVKYISEDAENAIELGGEDSKIIYFKPYTEQRMNDSCAGGTGAFIDQMASLLKTDAGGLDKLAENCQNIYPIAARCGVFAKTDIQSLINEGTRQEDIAASVFQAVVNQTISVLSRGKPIRGKTVFLGGPLTFLPQLRKRFAETLKLKKDEIIIPEKPELAPAFGAALYAYKTSVIKEIFLKDLYKEVENLSYRPNKKINLKPLFSSLEEIKQFRERHLKTKTIRKPLKDYKGEIFLGIDAGSTTTKIVLMGKNKEILYSYYEKTEGNPFEIVRKELIHIYNEMPEKAEIVSSCVTGYGEEFIKNTFKIMYGEVETVSHYKAAKVFSENAGCILDIGGQDIKFIKIKDNMIDSVKLNEACSSGCGSFIETLASSLKMSIEEFTEIALLAECPQDLGTKCTVFMNSKIREVQKEGASLGDISAGLAYSVVRNALFKVIRLKDLKECKGDFIAEGGTFYNDAVLRALEKILQKDVIRPDISGLMGAYGAAISAQEKYSRNLKKNNILSRTELENLQIKRNSIRCGKCTNNCLLTVNKFSDGRKYIYGNRCEKGSNVDIKKNTPKIPDLYEYKYKRVFDYKTLSLEKAFRGIIGIPRVLNMYENYPFWHTFFKTLGFKTILSDKSCREIYIKGIETIPSESVCYPAKIVHGHIASLIEKGIKTIFYPCIFYEQKEDKRADNHYNCPVVCGYPEIIKNNEGNLRRENIKFIYPYLNLENKKTTLNTLYDEFKIYKIKKAEISHALEKAYREQENYKRDVQKKGEETLEFIEKNNLTGIVLCGRPYHIDPEINHSLSKLIIKQNIAVLSEDSIAHLGRIKRPIRTIDEWTYHNRLYRAAEYICRNKRLEIIQLTSFGCGLDAVTQEQVKEILDSHKKIYTLIKIDEISNTGAVNIRIRSLKASIEERVKNEYTEEIEKKDKEIYFTKYIRENYIVLLPQLAPFNFQFLEPALNTSGYNIKILEDSCYKNIEEGLKYVNNDACYPAIIIAGQMITALKSGKYDLNKTAFAVSQTGGACRAMNYTALLKKALKDSGFSNIPVFSVSSKDLLKHTGLKVTFSLIRKVLMGMFYGDILMKVLLRTRPYEIEKGSCEKLYKKWRDKAVENVKNGSFKQYQKNIKNIITEFEKIPLKEEIKPKTGVIGEMFIQYNTYWNNSIINLIEKEGGEAVIPDFMEYFYYACDLPEISHKLFGNSYFEISAAAIIKKYMDYISSFTEETLKNSRRFKPRHKIEEFKEEAWKILSPGNQTGEGWFQAAEAVELIKDGVQNILCIQPFGCLPSHIIGKGIIQEIRRMYPSVNITSIDYDPGISKINQINRIKLTLNSRK